MEQTEFVLFEIKSGKHGDLGIITLNRPKALNALNHEMFLALDNALKQSANDAAVKAVVIKATEGRAFCAGGDIRHARQLKLDNNPQIVDFFHDEYQMNRLLFHFPKPYVALLDGITMGGGVGISWHGSYRVGTEQLVFAMPETGIGFYPDVGTTYQLSRLPHHVGIYLGLTGARINYADCLALGIVQQIVEKSELPAIVDTLLQHEIKTTADVEKLLQPFRVAAPVSSLLTHQEEINHCFSQPTVETILQALENYGTQWCQEAADTIRTKSPTSLKITLHALQKAAHMNFDACMDMEFRLTQHFIQGHDFFEGIRAVVIDKDQNPQWRPAVLSEVTPGMVEDYFAPVNSLQSS